MKKLLYLFVLLLVLTACKDSDDSKGIKTTENKEVAQTFLMYSEQGTSEDFTSYGDLYIKTAEIEEEKIASNVLNGQFEYIQHNDTVLFLTNQYELYEYKKGTDKEKLASNVSSFFGDYSDQYIFYYNEDSDLYIINEANETEKIASNVSEIDMVKSDLYYLNYDGDLSVYNVESRQEVSLGSDIYHFELLNGDGDLIYTNDDSMLYYKKNSEEAIRISSKEVNPYFVTKLKDSFVYITNEEKQVLYETSVDGSNTKTIASDVLSYDIKDGKIVYLTFDENLFIKSVDDEAAFKLASDVQSFTVSADLIFYTSTDFSVFTVTEDGEKEEKAKSVDYMNLAKDNSIVYRNDNNELFINDKKLATSIDGYSLFNNSIAYATTEDKLYFVEDLGEPRVISEDLSKYSIVMYQNDIIFTNFLTLSDISGDWKMTYDGDVSYVTISEDGMFTNRYYNTSHYFTVEYTGYNYLDVSFDGDFATFELNGDILTLSDNHDIMTLERISKNELEKVVNPQNANGDSEKETKSKSSLTEKTGQADLDTVPYPGAVNTEESARQQINSLIRYYLETYVSLDRASLEFFIHSDTKLYDEQYKYMGSLDDRGVSLSILDYSIDEIKQLSATEFKVTVDETYGIDHPTNGYSEPNQKSTYTVKLIDQEFYITAFDM